MKPAVTAKRKEIGLVSGDMEHKDLLDDYMSFEISVFMIAGVAWIAPLFRSIKHSEESLRSAMEDWKKKADNYLI